MLAVTSYFVIIILFILSAIILHNYILNLEVTSSILPQR